MVDVVPNLMEFTICLVRKTDTQCFRSRQNGISEGWRRKELSEPEEGREGQCNEWGAEAGEGAAESVKDRMIQMGPHRLSDAFGTLSQEREATEGCSAEGGYNQFCAFKITFWLMGREKMVLNKGNGRQRKISQETGMVRGSWGPWRGSQEENSNSEVEVSLGKWLAVMNT